MQVREGGSDATIAKLTGRAVEQVKPTTLRSRIEGTQQRFGREWVALHEEACDALAHAATHGDYTLLAFMYAGHKAPVRKALAGWLGMCSPLVVSGGVIRKSKLPDAPAYDVPAAMATTVDGFKPSPEEAEAFALAALAKMLAKKADAKDGTITDAAKRMAAKLHGMVQAEITRVGDDKVQIGAADAAKLVSGNGTAAASAKAKTSGRKAQAKAAKLDATDTVLEPVDAAKLEADIAAALAAGAAAKARMEAAAQQGA